MAVMDGFSLGAILALGFAFVMFLLVLFAAIYIYSALTLMLVAKKTKTEPAWFAWVPILNILLLAKMARMHWWPILLLIGTFIPKIGTLFGVAYLVFVIVWMWKVCERLSKPGWWPILVLIPIVGWIWMFILWGILAWDDTAVEAAPAKAVKEEKVTETKPVAKAKNSVKKKAAKKKKR